MNDFLRRLIGVDTNAAGTTTVFARLRQIVDDYLGDATIGLAQLESLVDDLETAVGAIEGATTLHDKLTAARAGYLDNLNNADLANVIRDVVETTDTFVFDETAGGVQEMVALAIAARAKVGAIWIDMVNVTQDTTIRLEHKIDGANFRIVSEHPWVVADVDGVLIAGFTAYRDIRVTLQCGGGGGGNVNVPYAIV